jgi:hypothetical protein
MQSRESRPRIETVRCSARTVLEPSEKRETPAARARCTRTEVILSLCGPSLAPGASAKPGGNTVAGTAHHGPPRSTIQ